MAPIDTSAFSTKARKDLLGLFENIPGRKNLVLQKALVGPIELLVKFSELQELGVDRIFILENDNVDASQRNVIFIACGEKAKQAQAIASQIKRVRQLTQIDHDYTVFWAPRRTLVCEKVLEDEGVLGEVTSLEWPLYLQRLESDLVSLELDGSFAELYLRGDNTSLFLSAKALMGIQQQCGLFPRILGKGDRAKRLTELLLHMRSETLANRDGVSRELLPSTTIENLIIIDRETDFSTVLMNQLTYEGLIDETFGISQNQCEISSSIVGSAPQPPSQAGSSSQPSASSSQAAVLKRKIKLDNADTLYAQLRDSNFSVVGGLLNRVARRLQSDYDSRNLATKNVSELRDFVNKLPGYQTEQQSLKIHAGLTEELVKQTKSEMFSRVLEFQQNVIAGTDPSTLYPLLEDLIARDCDLPTVLRLLCLASVIGGGFRAKDYDSFRRQIIQAYGYQHLVTLDALAKMELFTQSRGAAGALYLPGVGSNTAQLTSTNYSAVRRPLQLIMDDVSEQEPNDIAYAYSGYAPLSVRLIQCILQKPYLASLTKAPPTNSTTATPSPGDASAGWHGYEDVLKNIKGATFDETQGSDDAAVKARQVLAGHGGEKKTTVVFFLGGITFAEVAAVRFLTRQVAETRRVLLCTTQILSGDRMVGAAVEASKPVRI